MHASFANQSFQLVNSIIPITVLDNVFVHVYMKKQVSIVRYVLSITAVCSGS